MKISPFQRVMGRRATTMEKYLLAIIAVYVVVVGIKNPLFLSFETLFDMVQGGSSTMLLALGVLVVLLSGGIDVSITAVALVSGYLSVLTMFALGVDNIILAFLIAGGIGVLLGAINGLLVHALRLPALIVTLGTMSAFHGLMAVLVGTKNFAEAQMPASMIKYGSTDLLRFGAGGRTYGLTISVLVVAVVLVIIWLILYRTMLGRSVFAMGSSEESASRLGIGMLRTKLFAYSFSGAVSGLAGIMYFSEIKYTNPTSLIGAELMIIAAVVIGGAKLTGGQGTILGAVLGVVVLELFQTTLVFLGLSSSWNNLFFGGILLISLTVMYRRQRANDRRNLVFAAA